jgi:lysophospholipase
MLKLIKIKGLGVVSVLLFFSMCELSMALTLPFSSETQLAENLRQQIPAFWQQGVFSEFQGVADKRIAYAAFKQPQAADCVIISPGRKEGYLKYQELAYDIYRQGYNLVIIDHRGQGISERLQQDPHKGHVASFNDYVLDLQTLVSEIVPQYCSQKKYILAHSMGAAISARYMQEFPDDIDAAVLSSPMVAINSGGLPKGLAVTVINVLNYINQLVSEQSWYMPGHGGYQPQPFAGNDLTHSSGRYQEFVNTYQHNPEIQLGGVTLNWLSEAIKVEALLLGEAERLTTPTLILQAGDDTVVDNQAQDVFCLALQQANKGSCPSGLPEIIAGARHELFFESDEYRNQALTKALAWFAEH